MATIFLHDHKDFPQLLRIIEEETGIIAGLVEKDYWIMHCLYGLKKQGYQFQLKGGTSLSKGFGIINRFSEDIDMHIDPPEELDINENPKNSKPNNIEKKRVYYDQLTSEIKIDGIEAVRDTSFDDTNRYNSGGIRLYYKNLVRSIPGVKNGILLEVGFDSVVPNEPVTISSWAYDKAISSDVDIIDNRAVDIACYDYRYTFVEKLQAIATKYRREMETKNESSNYMRQYYDVYSLLGNAHVQQFIGSEEYFAHKKERFPKIDWDIPINENDAFLLKDENLRKRFNERYEVTKALYYKGQPSFEEILDRFGKYVDKL